MGFKAISLNGKTLSLHKSVVKPKFANKTVIVADRFDYVEMLLRRIKNNEALFYWQQAAHFFKAASLLPKESSPLVSYYFMLNASKALLSIKGVSHGRSHGVTGKSAGLKACLANEEVIFQRSGVLPALRLYFGDTPAREVYTLKDLMYNIPFIHRAFSLTYKSLPELFVPISNPQFVRKERSSESWFCANISDEKYCNMHCINKLGRDFEKDVGVADRFMVRLKRRFRWRNGAAQKSQNIQNLISYHASIRKRISYVYNGSRQWYIKVSDRSVGGVSLNTIPLMFAVMHRLSELCRYTPLALNKHFEKYHNWLLSEFIAMAPHQFLDEIASEITGEECVAPGMIF